MLRPSQLPAGVVQWIQTAAISRRLQPLTTLSSDGGNPTGPPAFVFDIDGVLIRGKVVLPAAIQAMQQVISAQRSGQQGRFCCSWVCMRGAAPELLMSPEILLGVKEGLLVPNQCHYSAPDVA